MSSEAREWEFSPFDISFMHDSSLYSATYSIPFLAVLQRP